MIMKALLFAVMLGTVGLATAQRPAFVRILVRHADPWLVKAMLEGISVQQPELSTILGFAGIPDQTSELIEELFGGQGKLVVNPTDNSLLFIPKRK